MTLIEALRMWRRSKTTDRWRCRCGRPLGERDTGCAWHDSVRLKVAAGLETEESAQ